MSLAAKAARLGIFASPLNRYFSQITLTNRIYLYIITRFDCVWMQTQKSPNDPHIRIRACGCKFHHYQPIPHFKILLDINFHWIGDHWQNGHHSKRLISIRNIILYLEIKFLPNRRIFVFWWPFWIQNGHHSNPTIDINSQHHNLLGNKISSKSEYLEKTTDLTNFLT